MKIYIYSVVAFTPDLSDPRRERSTAYHLPGIARASSIEEAAEIAKVFAFDRWKESDGYYGHQAAIIGVTKEFYDLADEVKAAGVVEMENDESWQCFPFDNGLDSEFIS